MTPRDGERSPDREEPPRGAGGDVLGRDKDSAITIPDDDDADDDDDDDGDIEVPYYTSVQT